MAAPLAEYPLLIMMEYYRHSGRDVNFRNNLARRSNGDRNSRLLRL